ncbi:hypothetical protein BY996DRAFT_6928969 [Phakopsora pachyrhizi]|nr:hypothetical protein BY996DRAFT_6928969 [Phakopsora pachyrhizi]
MPISDIFQSNNQNQPICLNISSKSTSTPATTTTTTATTTSTAAAAANTCNNNDGLQLSSDHRQPLSLADSSQPKRLSSAPDPEKGLNVVQYRELDKPLYQQQQMSKQQYQYKQQLQVMEKNCLTQLIAFDDLNQFWTSSSNTDQESFNNQSLHSFTDPRRPEPIQPRQQRDLSKRPAPLSTTSPCINKFPRERSSIDTFRTIQPSICNPIINNEFLTTTDQSQLSDNKNQTVFVETQGTNEEMLLFEQQMKQFLIKGRISEKELDDLCSMFDKNATCQERKNLWGQLFKECYKKTCELTKNATIGTK